MLRQFVAVSLACLLAPACAKGGAGGAQSDKPTPQQPTIPLPLAGLSGQSVAVLPVTMLLAEDELRWQSLVGEHRAALDRADSAIGASLTERAPEVTWVLPPQLRRSARQAPSLATDPDHMASAVLRESNMVEVPDPLRSQMRTLAALAGGSRFVLVPAAVFYTRAAAVGRGKVEVHMVLVDARTGQVQWRTVARAEGDDPWMILRASLKLLTPGLP